MQSQFNHKQPTRFNEPEIPQDLATKGYVDTQIQANNDFVFGFTNNNNVAFSETRFFGYFARQQHQATISTMDFICPFAFTNSRMRIRVGANTLDENSTFVQMVNGSPGNQTITIIALTAGTLFDDVNNDDYVLNDTLAMRMDASTSTVGNCNIQVGSSRGEQS